MRTITRLRYQTSDTESSKNSKFVFVLFWIAILFQVTSLKFIWSIESISRIVNFLILILLLIYTIIDTMTSVYSKSVWKYYIIPGWMIVFGMFLNISINALSNLKLVSFFGLILPWLYYLAIPSLIKKNVINTITLWKYFYYFLLCFNILGLIEYLLIFAGIWSMKVVEIPYGVFLSGKFSLLHMLEDGSAHYRYYACFLEPGTLAMFLLPAIAYAFFNKKYFGLIVFLVSFYFTDSLGGIISLLILTTIVIFILFNQKKNHLIFALSVLLISSSIFVINFGEDILKRYEEKDLSAKVREESLSKTIENLPILLLKNPLGINLKESTDEFTKNQLYVGSNFSPGTYLQFGGVSAFFGYIICILVSLFISVKLIRRYDLTIEEKVVYSSIIVMVPFIFQRNTIWESALFALLFAPTIIKQLKYNYPRILDNKYH